MSSVSGVSSSNSSSIYGTRNVLSGLATGLDTESMIENAVSGYQLKISNLQQQETKLTWEQDAYRNLTDPMVQFTRKYTSYTSSTNLLSASFFNNAVITSANGANADCVSATGKTASDIQILGVQNLASAATYRVSASTALGGTASGESAAVTCASVNLNDSKVLSTVAGSLTLTYGSNRTIDLSFDDLDIYSDVDAFASAINQKLDNVTLSNSDGDLVAASTMVKASVDENNNIVFSDNQDAGNSVAVTGAVGKILTTLNIDPAAKSDTLQTNGVALTDETTTVGDYLSDKTISVTVDGKTKTIALPTFDSTVNNTADFVGGLNTALQNAFGSGNIAVENVATDGTMQLKFTGQAGSTILVSATQSVGESLGLGGSSASSYVDVGKTLEDLLGTKLDSLTGSPSTTLLYGIGSAHDQGDGTYLDDEGNSVDADNVRLDGEGNQMYETAYDLVINDVKIGSYTKDTALETILNDIKTNAQADVSVSFSKTTNSFLFTARETGVAGDISIGATAGDGTLSNLAASLFGTVDPDTATEADGYVDGQDATFSMKVNGETYTGITRSSNNFSVDGLSITLKDTFADTQTDPVTFTTTADADTIVDAVKSMVDDLNAIMQSVHDAYSTQPLKKSDDSAYEPLTEDDESDMSDSAIEKYEEKAKTGILFGDSDLSSLYSKLLSAIQSSGTTGTALRSMGITTDYSQGLTTLSLDEDALRSTLDSDPDAVRDAFTSTSATGGLMTNLKTALDAYASTSSASRGILIQKAGSTYSSLSLLENDLQSRMNDLSDQIDKWQDKMSDQIDFYTEKFTKLEELTAQMNSQSSLLSGMLGSES